MFFTLARRFLCLGLVPVALLGIACGGPARDDAPEAAASSEVLASTKAAASTSDIAILPTTQLNWSNVLSTQIKTSNSTSLLIDMSMECGLVTNTTVRSKQGTKDTSTASASVMVQVLVDGVAAAPGQVVYCQRTQTLSATLSGILQSCTDSNGDGTITASECMFTDEEIALLLSTMNADAFNFVQANVGVGAHTIEVQAKIDTSTSAQTGSAEAFGFIGKGSVVVTSQRLGK